MKAYRKFKLPEAARPPAKVANPAKVRTPEPEALATLATLAAGKSAPDPDESEIEERKGMAADSVPEAYLDAWARLQCQRPRAPDDEWQLAINDAGGFLDAWGCMVAEFGWTSGELFDVPRGDGTSGLIWFLKGEPVRSLGPDHAVLGNGTHVFDRIERGEWIDRHAKGKR